MSPRPLPLPAPLPAWPRSARVRGLALLVAFCAVTGAGAVQAAGLGFMSKGPMAHFNEADMKLLDQALDRALAAAETGTAIDWSNAATGASGAITPLRAFEQGGRPCREVKVVNRHRQLESSGVYTLCRSEGRWTLAQ
jgi:surface antigen